MKNIFWDIKDRVDLKDLIHYYGLNLNRGGFACCPFHDERTPGFKVYEDHYHCFGCGEHGDHVDFVQKIYSISNIEAAKKIDRDFGLGLFDRDFAVPAGGCYAVCRCFLYFKLCYLAVHGSYTSKQIVNKL